MVTVLVTPRSLTAQSLDDLPELKPLRDRGWRVVSGPAGRLPSESELRDLLPGVDGWIAGVESVSHHALESADRLRVISRNGVGADAIDLAAAAGRGVRIELARGANSRGVAELAFALMLSSLRGIPTANGVLHAGGWARSVGRELADCTVGIVGFGGIGRLVGHMARSFDARVLAYDPYASIDTTEGVEAMTLSDVFARSDVVTLHSPPPMNGQPLVGAELLSSMPRGAVLVNTARSALVDADAVLGALDSGGLSAYAVDAFDSEPPALTPLLRHPKTILTPHLGGYTDSSVRRATEQAVSNLISSLES